MSKHNFNWEGFLKFLAQIYPKLRKRKVFRSDKQYKTYLKRMLKTLGVTEHKLFNCDNCDLHQWRYKLIDLPLKERKDVHYRDNILTALQAFHLFFKFLNGDIILKP